MNLLQLFMDHDLSTCTLLVHKQAGLRTTSVQVLFVLNYFFFRWSYWMCYTFRLHYINLMYKLAFFQRNAMEIYIPYI